MLKQTKEGLFFLLFLHNAKCNIEDDFSCSIKKLGVQRK